MRVLFTTPYPTDSPSGVGSFVRTFVGLSRRESMDPIVVEPNGREPPGIGNAWLAVRSAREILRRRRAFDVVHAQQLHPQSWAAAVIGRALGKGVVITVHGRQPQAKGLRSLAGRLVERASMRSAHRLVFVADSLQAWYGGAGEVIPNGVPVAELSVAENDRDVGRRQLGVGDAFVIVYVGRVTRDKGIPTLLEAFRMVRSRLVRPLRLFLIGPVESFIFEALEHQGGLGSEVRALGPRPNPWDYLAAADLFVLPSTREGLPLSLLEAMAAGLPVVATNVGDVPRAVRDRTTGLLVPPGNSEKLAEAVEWIADHPSEAQALGANARDLVRSEFDVARAWDSYQKIYEGARQAAN